jgi:hypothetical protein
MNTDINSPITDLIRKGMLSRGIKRHELGLMLAEGKNTTKAYRRLDELLRGDRFVPAVVQRVSAMLQIPSEQLAVVWEAHEKQERERTAESCRRETEETMARRGPHLWGRLPEKYYPSLITVLGAEFYLLVRLPEELVKLSHYEMIREVGEAVREHYQHHRRCRLIGYDYCQSLDEVYRFDADGEYVRRVDGNPLDSKTFVRIGKRTIETPSDLPWGGKRE